MWRRIIPKEFGLPGDNPEIWLFTVAADKILVQCDRLELVHGKYPIVVGAPSTTGHDVFPVSGLATTTGMQKTADFLINTFLKATRKSLNGSIIYDPSAIEPKDMMNGSPGKNIRLRRPMYGQAQISGFIHQLKDDNTTANHIPQALQFFELQNHLLGTQQVLSGNMQGLPERPTAIGLQNAQANALSRLQTQAQIVTEQIWYDLMMMMCYNNIQFMSKDVTMNIVGDEFDEQVAAELGIQPGDMSLLITPDSLDASFDLVPMNRMKRDVNQGAMNSVIERILSIPEIAMEIFSELDAPRLFKYFAREAGFESVHQFVKAGGNINARVVPDEYAAEQAQAGNMQRIPV